jgi:threonine/homoserine/homoserine lactone efflux protein
LTCSAYLTFLSVVLFATLSPGPSMLLAFNHGVSHGTRASALSGLGNIVGNLVLSLASLAALLSLLTVSQGVFVVVRWAGIAYLVYLGIRIWRDADKEGEWAGAGSVGRRGAGRLFLDGFWIAIANPKGLVFYTALFPQFVRFGQASVAEFCLVFGTLIVVGWLGFMLYAVFGQRVRRWFHRPRFRRGFNRFSGAAFIAAGVWMAWEGNLK